jgi:hypothetical protein
MLAVVIVARIMIIEIRTGVHETTDYTHNPRHFERSLKVEVALRYWWRAVAVVIVARIMIIEINPRPFERSLKGEFALRYW